MWIKRIVFENWRAYKQVRIDMPKRDDQNVVVIGAKNGCGKTSLLEGVTLCLYGEDGIQYLIRGESYRGYKEFIEGAFCTAAETLKSSVQVVFETDDQKELSVERIWHFGNERQFRSPEDIRVFVDGSLLNVPAAILVERDRVSYIEAFIAERILPHSLAPFFLFDGVQVQQLAQRRQKAQVQQGIEGILGIPLIRRLAKNLNEYAKQRRNRGKTGALPDSKIELLRKEINESEKRADNCGKQLIQLNNELVEARKKESFLTQQYGEKGGENVAQYGKFRERSGELRRERKELFKRLAESLYGDFAMSLAGSRMLRKTTESLRQENNREGWENTKASGGKNYKKFKNALEESKAFDLPLPKTAVDSLRGKIKEAWDKVWYPMPLDCAEEILNSDFLESERNDAIARLNDVARSSSGPIEEVRQGLSQNEAEENRINQKISSVRSEHAEEVKRIGEELAEVRNTINAAERKIGNLELQKEGIEKEITRKNQEFMRETERKKISDPLMYQSGRAIKVAEMCERIARKSYSQYVKSVARGMTSAYLAMAHKRDVAKIEINDDCDISLLNKQGRNIADRENAPSHGESEIFALALIAAISHASQVRFPFIIDTPLSNLDELHRRDFLRYFSARMKNQVIFLSTDAEIQNEQMALIGDNLAYKFLVEHVSGIHVVHSNAYFWEEEQ